MQKTCIIISGPTAVGKTNLSVHIASAFSTEIISADSRQCYKELNIGVAKPDPAALSAVKHHFIDSHTIHQSLNAADFEAYALNTVKSIFDKNDVAVLVGGTGLYIKAFTSGMDAVPEVPVEIREEIINTYKERGLSWLSSKLLQHDPLFADTGEMQNPQRMMRALEVALATGKSIRSFQQQVKKTRPFRIINIGLEWPRPILYDRINQRVDEMITNGLEGETHELLPYRHLQALQTVGYKEWFEGWEEGCSREMIIEKIKQNTRHYAKRQLTWFKRDDGILWMNPEPKLVLERIQRLI
jgi:tRNA dimethylallyltransferase